MSTRRLSDYRAPLESAPDDEKYGWFQDQFKQAQAFQQSQRAFTDVEKAHEFIAGIDMERLPDSYSRVDVNMGKRQIRENVATLANVRPLWGYGTDQKIMEPTVADRNKMLKAWHQGTFFDRSLKKVLQYAAAEGTGYARPYWDPSYYTSRRGEIAVEAYGASEVFPIQIGRDNNIQKAYAVIIHHQVPLAQAHARYPTKQHLITPDRDGPTGLRKVWGRVQRWLSPALNVGGTGAGAVPDSAIFPTVDIYEVFILDQEINNTGHEIAMGMPDSTWFYKVPYVGMEIPVDARNSGGQQLYRRALPEDCRMYPLRRRMEFSSKTCLTDGTNEDWHGKVPLIKFQLDSWPWEYLGFGMPRDYRPIQDSNRRMLRAIDDKINAGLNPSLEYDDQSIARSLMEEFDPRQPGQHLGTNMQMGAQVKPVFGPDYYAVPQGVFEHIDRMWRTADYLIGAPELSGLARLRQLPSDQSIEKIQEALGAIVWDYSREVERGLQEIGEMWLPMSFQRYDDRRVVRLTGESGIKDEWFDMDPLTAIPSHMPNEDREKASQFNYYQRARFYMDLLYMAITPNTAHQVTQMTRKLFLTQLYDRGFPIDPWTVAEAADIPDFGAPPQGTSTVMERYVFWKTMNAAIEARAAKLVQDAMAAGVEPDIEGIARTAKPPGRPPSGGSAPRMETKSDGDGGSRQTITQS